VRVIQVSIMPTTQKSRLESDLNAPLGIIAGSGMLPQALARRCLDMGRPAVVVALDGFADLGDFEPHVRTSLRMGQGKKIISFFKKSGVRDLVFIGALRRPGIKELSPDLWTLWKLGPALIRGQLGDDGLLRVVRDLFEKEGFCIHGVQKFLPELLASSGPLGIYDADRSDEPDIDHAIRVVNALGSVDVGQAAVIQNGIILGVEGAEGTSALITRCASLKRLGPGPILVKGAKPQQDHDLDLPTIGPNTVELAIRAGFRGIVVEQGATLLADPMRVIQMANESKIFILGRAFSRASDQGR
jgi:DUF1009 family protein